ncbi:TonB-dependent receptor, partial [bacterium]|nr:TonB-dependent receptor [bacterium]
SPIVLVANVLNFEEVNYILLHYKKPLDENWKTKEMLPEDGVYKVVLPIDLFSSDGVQYYIEIIDINEKSIDGFASKNKPQYIEITGEEHSIIKKTKNDDDRFFAEELAIYVNEKDNLKVKLASGKEESIFDAPLSTTVLTYDEIKKSGATSIQEALRLVPGMIVREQTSGNFDIHIRGFDNVPPNSFLPFSTNSISLLMIDNRVVYNYLNGGIFWEALPIDINDIERVEIIRGAASAMYGPNAAAGVMNIITKRVNKKNPSFSKVNVSYGNGNSLFANGIAGYQKDKIAITLSGNMQQRDRFDNTYWSWSNDIGGGWVDDVGDIKSVNHQLKTLDEINLTKVAFPHPEISVRKQGFNGFVNYDLTKHFTFDFAMGAQNSEVQKAFAETFANTLMTYISDTRYVDFKSYIFNDFVVRVSYLWGSQDVLNYPVYSNDVSVLNTSIDYTFNYNTFSIKPSLNYNRISYTGEGFGSGTDSESLMNSVALSLRGEFTLFDRLRLIGAGRVDKFSYNDNYNITYQFASTFKFGSSALLRAVYSRANRNPFMTDIYWSAINRDETSPQAYLGNKDLELMTMDMIEGGLRVNFLGIELDLEGFYSKAQDYDHLAVTGNYVVIDGVGRAELKFQNMELIAKQYGVTTNIGFNSDRFQIKIFGTFQQTDLENHNPNFLMNYKSTDLVSKKHESTPKFYGGGYINYSPINRLNININPYFYSSHKFSHIYGEVDIASKFILNGRVSYDITEKLEIYFNGRNILNSKIKEFGYTERVGGLYIIGANVEY